MSSLVPEGWVSTTIGEATSGISDGGTPATSNAEYFNGSIPWVVIDDIQPRIVHTKSSITELGLQKSSAKLWDKGTIILSTGATIGEVGIAMKAMATKQGICGVVVKSDVSAKYFYHLLVSKKRQLNTLSQGSTIKETRPPTVKKIEICLPPLPEQKKIASILTSVDEVIENTQKQIDKLQDLKKATMNELLTKGIGHTEFKDSELGRIPKSWEVGEVSIYCEEVFLGLTSKVDYVDSGGVPLIRATDISKGRLSFEKVRCISEAQHQKLTKYRQASRGDILVSKSGSLGVCAIVDTDKDFSIYESIIVLKPIESKLQSQYLLWFMRSPLTQQQLQGDKVGSTVGHLNLNDFRNLKITIPSLIEQNLISQQIVAMNELEKSLEQKLSQTQSLKKSLMQDLLTGKVRVTVN